MGDIEFETVDVAKKEDDNDTVEHGDDDIVLICVVDAVKVGVKV